MFEPIAPSSRPRPTRRIVTIAGACGVIALTMAPAAWIWSHRSPPDVSPDRAHSDWKRPPLPDREAEPLAPGAAARGASGVPLAIASDEEPFVSRRNFVERMQTNEYLAAPVRPLPASQAQAGGSPAPRRRGVEASREISGKDCACARLDPACACLPTAPACPVARGTSDEPCRYF